MFKACLTLLKVCKYHEGHWQETQTELESGWILGGLEEGALVHISLDVFLILLHLLHELYMHYIQSSS